MWTPQTSGRYYVYNDATFWCHSNLAERHLLANMERKHANDRCNQTYIIYIKKNIIRCSFSSRFLLQCKLLSLMQLTHCDNLQ